MLDRLRVREVAADRNALLTAVAAAMQRLTSAERDPQPPPRAPTPAPAGLLCPSCGQAGSGRLAYLGLLLCRRCGSALPQGRQHVK